MPFPKRSFLDKLVQSRFRQDNVRKILKEETQNIKKARPKPQQFITGTHKGQFYRIQIPRKQPKLATIPKLHTPTSPPMKLPLPSTDRSSSAAILSATKTTREQWWNDFKVWLRENSATLVLNFGSICTLIGFTRSDVLELRSLAVSGSLCAIIYHVATPPIRYPPIVWSATFAIVNSLKIFQILQERKGSVNLNEEQEEQYTQFFMPHGITPKQFEYIHKQATTLHVKKDSLLVKKGDELKHVYLVVSGSTRASILGRFLTAASVSAIQPTEHDEEPDGGTSGAWIGEMALLDMVWRKEKGKQKPKKVNGDEDDDDGSATPPTSAKNNNLRSMYTIVADKDCTVLRWSHDDMQELMERSHDMRSALTRAMTAAIVGKVIKFTVSRSSSRHKWSTWLDDWKNTQVRVDEDVNDDEEVEEKKRLQENLPQYPIKRFR